MYTYIKIQTILINNILINDKKNTQPISQLQNQQIPYEMLFLYINLTLTCITKKDDTDTTETTKNLANIEYNILKTNCLTDITFHFSIMSSYLYNLDHLKANYNGEQEVLDFGGILNTVQYDNKLCNNKSAFYRMYYVIHKVFSWMNGFQEFNFLNRFVNEKPVVVYLDGWYMLKNYLENGNYPDEPTKNDMKMIKGYGVVKKIVRIVGPNRVEMNTKYEYVIKTIIHCYKNRRNEWIIEHKIEKSK